MTRLCWVLVLLAGCMSEKDMDLVTTGDESLDSLDGGYRFDVTPPEAQRLDRAFVPQTFQVSSLDGALQEFHLEPTVRIEGTVSYFDITPTYATLPGDQASAAGLQVALEQWNSIQSANAVVGESGEFGLQVAPGAYDLLFQSTSPTMPSRRLSLQVEGDDSIDTDLGYGLPVWGRVLRPDGSPLAGAFVQAFDAQGLPSGMAQTDESGAYTVRVDPGTYQVVCYGTDSGRVPVLRSEPLTLTETGAEANFQYANLTYSAVALRLEGSSGDGIDNAIVRFQALSLEGYADTASLTLEDSSSSGNVNVLLLPGEYTVEVLPHADSPYSGYSTTVSVDDSFVEMPETVLADLTDTTGVVTDPDGSPVPGALVVAMETASGGRSWSTTTNDAGQFVLALPNTAMEFLLTPPADRRDLPMTYTYGPDLGETPVLTFVAGFQTEGVVLYPDADGELQPAEYAVVDVIGGSGRRIGSALTNSEGEFSLSLAP